MGKFVFNDDRVVVLIPKNASSTMSAMLQHHLRWGEAREVSRLTDKVWIEEAYPHLTYSGGELRFAALVRHPIDRWVSGMAQKYAGMVNGRDLSPDGLRHIDALLDDDRLWRYVETAVHDEHTARQSDSLNKISPLTLFKLGNAPKLWSWLGCQIPAMPDYHIHRTIGYQREVVDHLREALDRMSDYREYLLDFYRDDLALYEKAD